MSLMLIRKREPANGIKSISPIVTITTSIKPKYKATADSSKLIIFE